MTFGYQCFARACFHRNRGDLALNPKIISWMACSVRFSLSIIEIERGAGVL